MHSFKEEVGESDFGIAMDKSHFVLCLLPKLDKINLKKGEKKEKTLSLPN